MLTDDKKVIKNKLHELLSQNAVLISGLIISPVVYVSNTLQKAVAIIIAFSLITFFTVIISTLMPKKMQACYRIILYTIISGIVYVPVYFLMKYLYNDKIVELGIILPLLVFNLIIVTSIESKYINQKKNKMILNIFFSVIGVDLVILIIGFIREVFGSGTLWGFKVLDIFKLPILIYPFGGFIILGVMAALFRKIINPKKE